MGHLGEKRALYAQANRAPKALPLAEFLCMSVFLRDIIVDNKTMFRFLGTLKWKKRPVQDNTSSILKSDKLYTI